MQQAKRQRTPGSWRLVLARWLLAVAVVVSLSPPSTGPTDGIARAAEGGFDLASAGRAVAADESTPEHAVADDGIPVVPPPDVAAASVANGDESAPAAGHDESAAHPESVPSAHVAAQPDESDAPDDEPPAHEDADTGEPAPPVAGNRRAPYVRAAPNPAAAACPAELGIEKAASFGRDDRLVMTYYYYWYDEASLENPALAQRPPAYPPMDWRSVAWHERQLLDMASAGIDVALAVYWGDTDTWSTEALEPMVEARERLLAAGFRPPALGLFFDTNMYALILPERPELNDLTTDDGLDMLSYQVGGFLDRVPPCHRARVDGRPLVFFWRADTEDGDQFKFDENTFDSLADRVAAEHGERIHPVVERSWQEAADRARVDLGAIDVYRWGAALNGPRFEGRTVAVGPGYDDTRIDGRPGYTRERTDGGTYSRDLRQAVMSGTTWLLLETWNELWEGTAIAETEETGRTYLGITARYATLFHQLGNERARDAWFDLGSGHNAYLRRLADAPIEQGMPGEGQGRWGARPHREEVDGTGYFHFALDRRLGFSEARPLTVTVEYFDEGDGSFAIEYDSLASDPIIEAVLPPPARILPDESVADGERGADDERVAASDPADLPAVDASAPVMTAVGPLVPPSSAYRRTEAVAFENTRTWRTHSFQLPDASLLHRQYDGGGDFRLHDMPGPEDTLHLFGRVTVTAELAERPIPFEPESLTFVNPGPRESVMLRWTEATPAAGYLVIVQPFDLVDDTDRYGFTTDDGRRCIANAPLPDVGELRGRVSLATCELRLARDLEEGVYRWRVQALDAAGGFKGQSSDWSFFVVVRR